MIHLDTTFLIDLLRERGRSFEGPATRLLDRIAEEELGMSVHVACELFAGAELASARRRERSRVEELSRVVEIRYPDERFAPTYGTLLARLEKRGERVSTMDLLIATAAILDGAPLVTRNARDFARVPRLRVIKY